MKGYIISVICISVITSLISMLTPDGEGGEIGKNMKLICGLCIVFVSINPIIKIVDGIKSLDIESIVEETEDEEKYQDKFDSSYTAAELANLKSGIKQMLSDRFGVDMSECDVALTVQKNENGQSELVRIFITLYGSAIFKNTAEIEKCLCDIFNCEIVTAIG